MEDILITTKYMKRNAYCISGVKTAIVKVLGEESWRKFVKEGLYVSELGTLKSHPDLRKVLRQIQEEKTAEEEK